MQAVSLATGTVLTISERTARATAVMHAGADEVGRAIESIAAVSEQSAAGAEQVSASAEEQAANIEEMTSNIGVLGHLSEQLREVVNRFRLDQADAPGDNDHAPKQRIRRVA